MSRSLSARIPDLIVQTLQSLQSCRERAVVQRSACCERLDWSCLTRHSLAACRTTRVKKMKKPRNPLKPRVVSKKQAASENALVAAIQNRVRFGFAGLDRLHCSSPLSVIPTLACRVFDGAFACAGEIDERPCSQPGGQVWKARQARQEAPTKEQKDGWKVNCGKRRRCLLACLSAINSTYPL